MQVPGSVDDGEVGSGTDRNATAIGEARHLVMLATGESKARPIAEMIEGPVRASCPASALQFHPHVTVLIDDAAAHELAHADHYRETYRHKPSWQQL